MKVTDGNEEDYVSVIQIGDLVEAKLGQERDVVKVLKVAENGNKRDKRVAAFELATMAAFSEDNRYLIGDCEGSYWLPQRINDSYLRINFIPTIFLSSSSSSPSSSSPSSSSPSSSSSSTFPLSSAGEMGGIETILRLFDSDDSETVDYAAETIANLATVQPLQVRPNNTRHCETLRQ